jgi:photosystem II stability/assembly factor-like uncharacterized protein
MRTIFRFLIGAGLCTMNFAASATTRPIPWDIPEVLDIQAGADNEIYVFVSRSGVFRRTDGHAWVKVVNDEAAAYGRIFRKPDGMLMLSNFGGGTVYVSFDRGVHWQKKGISQTLPELTQIFWEHTDDRRTAFSAVGDAYVLSREALLFSDNGGITWQRRSLPPQMRSNTNESQSIVANEAVVFLLSGGSLYKSEDKGSSWSGVEQGAGAASPIRRGMDDKAPLLRFDMEGKLLAIGPATVSQRIEASADNGKNWHAERYGFSSDAAFMMSLFGPAPEAAYFFVRSDPPSVQPFKAIYRKPANDNATEISYDANNVRKIMLAPDGKLYIVLHSPRDAVESVDGGKTWKRISHEGITR